MRRVFSFILLSLVFVCTTQAQKRKPVAQAQPKVEEPKVTVDECIQKYDFAQAEDLLNKEIATLTKKKQPTLQQEKSLSYVRLARQKMNAVEKVVVFDSLIVPRQRILSSLCLSTESGSMHYAGEIFPEITDSSATLFMSQLQDKMYFAQPTKAGILQLMFCERYNDGITEPQSLAGLDDNPDEHQDYPYMMADGATLYFAAQGDESLGGYDIFMTRYDADEHKFLAPENIGMPFNSSANDYLYCVDEFYNIGCFVTDRNTSADSVCIYYFIPSDSRKVYIEDEVGTEALRSLAKLSNIKLTWGEEMEIRLAMSRLQNCRSQQETESASDFDFRVVDNRICHSINDFTSAEARQEAASWLQNRKTLSLTQSQLSTMRDEYNKAYMQERDEMSGKILELEKQEEELIQLIKNQEKNIRKIELGL